MPVHSKMSLVKLILVDTHIIQEIKSLDVPSRQLKLYTYEYSYMHKRSFLDFKSFSMKCIRPPKTEKSQNMVKQNHKIDSDYVYFNSLNCFYLHNAILLQSC